MSRESRKGATFERAVADYLKEALSDDRVDRRVKRGVKDTGDITGVRTVAGGRVVVEVKNQARLELAAWVDEAEVERGNDDALIGVVIHKRRGRGPVGYQYVTMTVDALVHLLNGGLDTSREVVADPMTIDQARENEFFGSRGGWNPMGDGDR